jgi:hypothetical protein
MNQKYAIESRIRQASAELKRKLGGNDGNAPRTKLIVIVVQDSSVSR